MKTFDLLSVLINLGILIVTALVGILAWYEARCAAREARKDQETATAAAERIATATEQANWINSYRLAIEQARQAEETFDRRAARLTATVSGTTMTPLGEFGDLVIYNSGASGARDIQVLINKKPVSDYRAPGCTTIPKEAVLGPKTQFSIRIIITKGLTPRQPLDVDLTWSDDSARGKSSKSTII